MKNALLCISILASALTFGQQSEIIIATPVQHGGMPPEVFTFLSTENATIEASFTTNTQQPKMVWKVGINTADPSSILSELNVLELVYYAEVNHPIESFIERHVPNDFNFNDQWYLDNDGSYGEVDADVDLPEAWAIEKGSDDVVLAIIDGGVQFNHPEFDGRRYINPNEIPNNGLDDDGNGYVDDFSGWDFVDGDSNPNDGNGHGTAVAGIAAANGDDNLGFAGVDWNCRIMSVRVLNNSGGGDYFNLAAALYYVADNGVDVVNMSLGGLGTSQTVEEAVEYAAEQGVLMVAASGNRGDVQPQVPARYPEVMAVGSINAYNDRSDPFTGSNGGSSYGAHLDVMAPGDQIPILDYQNFANYSNVANGTSLAAPIVSGIACLAKAQHPEYTNYQIKTLIEKSAEDQLGSFWEDTPGKDIYYGYGRVNAHAVVSSDFYTAESGDNDMYIWSDNEESRIIVRFNTTANNFIVSDISGRILYSGENTPPHTLQFSMPESGVFVVSCEFPDGVQSEKVLIH